MGMRMFSTGSPTVISIPSGVRRGSYLRNAADEQERLVTRLDDPLLPVELLASDPTSCAPGPRPTAALRSRVWRSSITPLAALGISPRWVDYTIRRRLHRGEHLDALRRHRGLDVIPPAGSNVAELRRRAVQDLCVIPDDGCIEFVTAGNGVRFMATGWSHPERWGTWNDGTTAALMFRTDGEELPDTARARLTVTAHADDQHPVQRVRAEVAGTQTAITLTGSGPHTIELDVGPIGRQPSVVKFHFSDAWRPRGPDSRCLAIGLISAVFV